MICTGYNNFPTNFNIFLHHCHIMLSSYCTNSLLITFFLAFHHTLSHFYNADNCLFTPYPFISVFIYTACYTFTHKENLFDYHEHLKSAIIFSTLTTLMFDLAVIL